MSCYITGCGAALPARVVTNAELSSLLGVAPEFIEENSGIRERRWVEAHQSTSDLAAAAVREALSDARKAAADIDYLIGCTLSPDYQVPGIAPLVQRKLEGCASVPAVDLRVGCAGVLYSLQLARGLIQSSAAKTVACFGAEAQSKGLNLKPESAELSMLFGDGAGAFVMSDTPGAMGEARDYSVRLDDVLIETDWQIRRGFDSARSGYCERRALDLCRADRIGIALRRDAGTQRDLASCQKTRGGRRSHP